MMKRKAVKRLAAAGLALGFGALACALPNRTTVGEVRTESQSVDLGSASSARVDLSFPAGELRVEGGAGGLMDASFRYNVADWQPQVDYSVQGSEGDLRISQPGAEGGGFADLGNVGDLVNDWTIQLGSGVPLDLTIQVGAGESTLNLGSLDLTRLSIETGAGISSVDLTGNWQHDVDVSISAGVGELTVTLPAEMGVRVNPDTAVVSVTTSGLTQDGGGYVNSASGTAPYTLTLDLEAGVGSVTLRVP
jgi:hypothetical protein